MAFIHNTTPSTVSSGTGQIQTTSVPELSKEDIEFLLTLMKNSTVKGKYVELFYHLAIKLQTIYQSK